MMPHSPAPGKMVSLGAGFRPLSCSVFLAQFFVPSYRCDQINCLKRNSEKVKVFIKSGKPQKMGKEKMMSTDKIEGMGAIPHQDGIAFRVWAPNARKVFVMGSFNDWNETKNELVSENNGFWYANIEKAHPGDEYKYVIFNGDNKLVRNDPYAKEMTNSAGNSIVSDPDFDWKDDAFDIPSWNELVIYEIHIGTFNTEKKNTPGSFKSVQKKIPWLKDLGINAIEIMPLMEFSGDYSWGYNPAHPFAVETSYGSPHDFKTLIREAHQAGIAVILDVVYNHFGPDDMDLWRFDGWYENNKGGIYFYNDWRSKTPWGDTRPDYGRPEVKQYLRDNALMWLEEYHVDGLRFDGTAFIRNAKGQNNNPSDDIDEGWSFMQWINEEMAKRSPNKISIAEDLWNNAWITKSIGEGGCGFGSQWDNNFVHAFRDMLALEDDNQRDMLKLVNVIDKQTDKDAFSRIIYTESHDETAGGHARIPEEITPGNAENWFARKRSVLGASLVLTSLGIPLLFQGQEFLTDKWFHIHDLLDWNRAKQYEGLVSLYRKLIALRRNLDNTTKGLTGQYIQVHHINNKDKVIAFHRWQNGGPRDSVIVIANFKNTSYNGYVIGFPDQGSWKVRFNSDWKGYDKEFTDNYTGDPEPREGETDGMPFYAPVSIGPYAILILSQE